MKRIIVVWASIQCAAHVDGATIHVTGPDERQVEFGDGTTSFATLSGGEGYINSTVTVSAPEFVTMTGTSVNEMMSLIREQQTTIISQQVEIAALKQFVGMMPPPSSPPALPPSVPPPTVYTSMVYLGKGFCRGPNGKECEQHRPTYQGGRTVSLEACKELCLATSGCIALTLTNTNECALHNILGTAITSTPEGYWGEWTNAAYPDQYGCTGVPDTSDNSANGWCYIAHQ